MISSISHVKDVLAKYNTGAKKKFGQNFIIDSNIVDKIAKSACNSNEITIEIGPGLGSLTEMLIKYSKKVITYEIDKDMYEILCDEFKGNDKVENNLIDFLDLDLNSISYKDEVINVCSNLPYYVTTPILFKLFESDLKINKITVMVQKEVADRFEAKVGSEDYNALTILVNYLYNVKLVTNVSRHVFYPSPNVDSAVISFTPKIQRNKEYEKGLFELIKYSFMKRRKTLYNNLKDYLDMELIKKIYSECNLKETVRAQELTIDDYIKIYKVIQNA